MLLLISCSRYTYVTYDIGKTYERFDVAVTKNGLKTIPLSDTGSVTIELKDIYKYGKYEPGDFDKLHISLKGDTVSYNFNFFPEPAATTRVAFGKYTLAVTSTDRLDVIRGNIPPVEVRPGKQNYMQLSINKITAIWYNY